MAMLKRMPTVKNPVEKEEKSRSKNPAAVALGRLGGKAPKSRPFGFAAIPKKRVMELSKRGVAARKRLKRAG